MQAIKTQARIHPLMAAAAASVIIVSLAATAAITGFLPSSKGAPDAAPPVSAAPAAYGGPAAPNANSPVAGYGAAPAMYATAAPAPALASAAQYPAQYAGPVAAPATGVQSAPVAEKPVPALHRAVHHKPVHHYTQTARYDEPNYEQRPAPAQPRQPNYLAIGTGAVVGGLLGNQVGGGNGRKLATVAGIIGGGMLGNEIANRDR